MKIVFICPYFGKLPNYFPIWLKACEYNKDINWIVFTDDETHYNYPKNVKVNYLTFSEFSDYIKKRLKIEIRLDKPYKLCDFKPLYGDIFQEYIKEYDFWGHCDIDCIFGNIRKFITDEVLNKYDKILFLGHMTLYRNKKEVNERYKIKIGDLDYKQILNQPMNYAFDESFKSISINMIYDQNKFPFYKKEIYFDICPLYYDFRKCYYKNQTPYVEMNKNVIFEWKDGTLIAKSMNNKKMEEKEYAYVHFQKRKVKNQIEKIQECRDFVFIPNKIFSMDNTMVDKNIQKYLKRKKIFYSVYFKQRFKNFTYKLKKTYKEKIKGENSKKDRC